MNDSSARRASAVMAVAVVAALASLVFRSQMMEAMAESAAVGELGARVELAEGSAARALALAGGDGAGDGGSAMVGSAIVGSALVDLDDAIRTLQAGASVGLDAEVGALADEIGSLADEIRIGSHEAARFRYSTGVVADRRDFDRAAQDLVAELDGRVGAAETRFQGSAVVAVLAASAAGLWFVVAKALAGRRDRQAGRHEAVEIEPERLIIQLPVGENELPMRRRHPKSDDLAWLLGQVLAPFERRGWSAEVTCPSVGVDCDPADVREIVGSVLGRAERAGAERIGIVVRPSGDRVSITIADDGASVFGDDGNAVGTGPVQLRSAVRTRTEALGATLTWDRRGTINTATLDLPRLTRERVSV